ncbi:MAG: ATP-binding protein [Coriobacteriia bacterium]|nr:ATP-binding protein [Coriobacteriia bacterium]MCL2537188.1 ATP-binding protein [Coriobacteriia bacterium]
MKLLKACFDGVKLFKDERFEIDFQAKDRVMNLDDVFPVAPPVHTQKVVALAGINASGKTTVLKLLYMALNILTQRPHILEGITQFDIFSNKTTVTLYFYLDGDFFKLESQLQIGNSSGDSALLSAGSVKYHYVEERLWSKKARPATKKDALLFRDTDLRAVRSQLPDEVKRFVSDTTSIAIAVLSDEIPEVEQLISSLSSPNKVLFAGDTPPAIIQMFDPSVEYLINDHLANSDTFSLKFKNSDSQVDVYGEQLSSMLSAGTIKGNNVMVRAIAVLQTGGYLIIDEIENHFNKKLVNIIIEMFMSEEYNPHGATLIFSTHYVEILDVISRKDNVYFLIRDDNYEVEVVNYSDRVSRVENKKSEVFASNFIKGTAPKFTEVRSFQNLLKKALNA